MGNADVMNPFANLPHGSANLAPELAPGRAGETELLAARSWRGYAGDNPNGGWEAAWIDLGGEG